MAEERRLAQVGVDVGGARLPAELYELLSLVRVEESVHLPDVFVLRFADPHFELFDAMRFTMGTRVDIAFAAEGDLVTVTRGEVTSLSVEQGSGGLHELVVAGLDVAHRLSRGPKSRSFQQMSDADIVAQIAEEHGLDADVDSTSEINDYVLQSSESDHAFLKRRADQVGFDLWVADSVLHFKQRAGAKATPPAVEWGGNLHKFKVRFSSAERSDEVTVRAWDPRAKAAIVGRATEGERGTTAPAAAGLAETARKVFGDVNRFAGQLPVRSQAEADALARSLLLKASGDEVTARGEASGDPMIAAGANVDVRGVGQQLSGTYQITSVEHVYGAGTPYVTRFTCGGKEPAGLSDLLTGTGGNGARSRGWGSLVIGTVTNNEDPEDLGRVKVKFPSLTDSDESTWAKVVAPGAGRSRGFQCLPEVNDEVLVGFEHDDKHRPLVIGGLWNMDDPPPDRPSENGVVMWRNWVSRNGHSVTLSDRDRGSIVVALGDGKASLTLQPGDSVLRTDDTITVKGKKVVVQADSELQLRGETVRIEATGRIMMNGARVDIN